MIAIVGRGVCSPLGEGDAALGALRPGEAPVSRVARDEELATAGLSKPFVARARLAIPDGVDRARVLLEHAIASCARDLDESLPGWRALRVGAAIGTSSGGMRSFERVLDANDPPTPDEAISAMYIGPFAQAVRPVAFEPVSLVLGACASSTLAIGLARAWLLEDRCDVALCGGFDAVSVFVAAGFESLRATCGPRGPRPFREGRDGLALGESAAILALVRDPAARRAARVLGWISGFGASCDATHLTAPDSAGAGLARAAEGAIANAGAPAIDLVSAHGTATPQNDRSEAAAIVRVLGDRASGVPVYSVKGAVGHTLGAAGALEVLAAADAIAKGIAPASVGEGPIEAGLRVLDRAEDWPARSVLKLSSAFGGANAALVVTAEPPAVSTPSSRTDVFLSKAVAASLRDADAPLLAERTGYPLDRLARADELVRLAIAATASLEDASGGRGALRGAGIIVGHGLATIETNARFWSRIRAAGASRAEPRRFPYTTPNAPAGECAVAFGLTGPAFAVGGGPHGGIEAIAVAADLVRARVIDRIVVVAVDEVGEAARRIAPGTNRSGAVALLVSRAPASGRDRDHGRPAARLVSATVSFDAVPCIPSTVGGLEAHPALLPLVTADPPSRRAEELRVEIPWGGFAIASFLWL